MRKGGIALGYEVLVIGGCVAEVRKRTTIEGIFDLLLLRVLKKMHVEWWTVMYDNQYKNTFWEHCFVEEKDAVNDFEKRVKGEGIK